MEHFKKGAKNAKMVSWKIENEVTDRFSNKEILLLYFRYVGFCGNEKPYICETFF